MSDPTPKAPDPLAREMEALRQRFSALDRQELVELAVELTATYVLDGLSTIGQATLEATPKGYDEVGDETFAGLLRRLKTQRPGDPILEKFIVNGEHLQVRTPTGNVDVTEYRRPTAPAPPPSVSPPPPSVPPARDSIYNRELYGQPPANAQRAPAGANPSRSPAAPPPAATPGAQQDNGKAPADQKPQGDRFRMIELD